MNPASETIPGLRRPDARERAWIAEHWGHEIDRKTFRKNGKFLRFVAIFLAAMSAVGMVRGEDGVGGAVVGLILAVICFALSRVLGKSAGTKDRRLHALAAGDYYVAQATSVKIGYSQYEGLPRGFAEVRLADGRMLNGHHQMPYDLAKPLMDQNINSVPILLIQLPGESRILTIPVPR